VTSVWKTGHQLYQTNPYPGHYCGIFRAGVPHRGIRLSVIIYALLSISVGQYCACQNWLRFCSVPASSRIRMTDRYTAATGKRPSLHQRPVSETWCWLTVYPETPKSGAANLPGISPVRFLYRSPETSSSFRIKSKVDRHF